MQLLKLLLPFVCGTSNKHGHKPSVARTSTCCKSRHHAISTTVAQYSGAAIASEQAGVKLNVTLHPGLDLLQQTVDINGNKKPVIVPLDIMLVLEMYLNLGLEDRDPYWARPWPSGVALAQVVLQQPHLVYGRNVCEVGAGLGLAGLAAAQAGAGAVTLLDREAMALQCAALTGWAWGVPMEKSQELLDVVGRVKAELMEGGKVQLLQASSASSCPVTARLLDWHNPDDLPRFDVVLLCDVLYEKFSVEPVGKLCTRLLAAGGRILLADPTNRTRENRDAFVELLRDSGLSFVIEEHYTLPVLNHDKFTDVSIMNIRAAVGKDTVGVKL